MSAEPDFPRASSATPRPGRDGERAAFICITTLFFVWGFITVTVDPLIAAMKSIFQLSYAEVMLTQFAFFMAYGIISLPAAALVTRLGYAGSILTALAIMIAGCLWVPFATHIGAFAEVLVALFIIASGITILQVAANPLAAALGPPERAHLRLTLSQAFNSLGTAIAPYLASTVLLAGGIFALHPGAATASERAESLRHIDFAFLCIAALIALLAAFIGSVRKRLTVSDSAPGRRTPDSPAAPSALHSLREALRSSWAVLGAAAIFLYVGSEVSIGSNMALFLNRPDVFGVPLEQAGKWVSLYWGGAMIGRFIGSALLARVRASGLLALVAAVAAALCFAISHAPGALAGWAALSVGLVNSIMFPVIFTLTLERSSASRAATSGLLCMAIVGGAVLPVIVGRVADATGLRSAYIVPMLAYLCICAFGIAAGGRTEITATATDS